MSETARQTLHVLMGAFALLLRYLTWPQAAACALAALLFNAIVLPRVGGRALYRPGDHARGYPAGILIYPLSVLLLILAFPARPDIVAAAWGVLAAGDGTATLIGTRFGRTTLPWNREKTWVGTAAFAVGGAVAGAFLAWWTAAALAPPPDLRFLIGAPVAAALVAALVETIPVRLDDNLSTPLTAAGVLWGLSLVSADAVSAHAASIAARSAPAVVANGAVAWLGWRARTVTVGGAVTGAVIGTVIYAATGWEGWTLLLAAFLAATSTSRLGLERKVLLGIAEERAGRRGAGNALANTGLAAAAAALAVTTPHQSLALIAFVAALVAGSSDTVASEVGKAHGRRAYLVLGLSSVPPGTPGAVSLEGTAAGVASAAALGALGGALGLVPVAAIARITIAATVASFVEGGLAAAFEARGLLNNDLLNVLNTACAAALALALGAVLP